jgi:energy-coupling factor transporter ATP-binding protein EcfA2
VACRLLPERKAAGEIVSAAVSLAQLAAVLDGGVTLRLGVDHGNGIRLAVHAGSPDATGVGPALTEVLSPIGDVATLRDDPRSPETRVWDLVPVVASGAPGFRTGISTVPTRWAHDKDPGTLLAEIDEITGLLSRVPEVTYSVNVETGPQTEPQTFLVRPRLESTTGVLALSVEALARRVFPGLRPVPRTRDLPTPGLLVGERSVPSLVRIPVATRSPLAGVATAAAAARPIAPTTTSGRERLQDGAGVRIGFAEEADHSIVDVLLTRPERARHVHVLGKTGTGKSTLLAALGGGIATAGESLIVLDPHSQLVDRIVAEMPPEVAARTWLIRAGDLAEPFRFNPLAVADPQQRELVIAEIGDILQRLYDPKNEGIVGPRFIERCSMALRALCTISGSHASLLDVPGFYADDRLVKAVKNHPDTEARLASWLGNEAGLKRSTENGELNAWVSCKFEQLSGTPAMRSILGTGADSIDWGEAMDHGQIILVDLSIATLGQTASRLLGLLIVNAVWTAALRRRGTTPVTLMVDEAHSLHAGAMDRILSEGRKFGLSLVLAHQYLDQLPADLRAALDGNAGTTVAFRTSPADGSALADRYADPTVADDLPVLPDLQALTLRSASTLVARPFTLHVDHNDDAPHGSDTVAQVVRANTRRDLVEPHRGALPLFGTDRLKEAYSRLEKGAPPPSEPRSGFVDVWLEQRRRAADHPAVHPTEEAS